MSELADYRRGGASYIWAILAAAIGAACIAVLFVRSSRVSEPQRQPRPNVILITLDTTRADRLGCYGARHDTPAIDSLARAGIRFENCYAVAPITLPTHCSILTGLQPLRHGVHENGAERLPDAADTLAEVLSHEGYATAAVVGAFVLDHQYGLNQGFDRYDDQMPAGSGNQFRDSQRSAPRVTDAALAIVAEPRKEPLFLWVHYFDPHAPYDPPKYDPTFATLSPYEAEIALVDEQIKRLLARIDQLTERPTIVILTADHGEGLGQHGEDTHGLFTYNQTMRVPLVVQLPDESQAGRVVRTPVSQVDVVPTVLELLELEAPGPLDGQPLPLGEATAATDAHPRAIYFENRFPVQTYGWSAVDGVVVGRHKLIRAPQAELYDLELDPREEHNLFQAEGPASQRMLAHFDEELASLTARHPLDAETAAISDEDLARLRSLGYVGASRESQGDPAVAASDRPNPKDMLEVYNQIQEATILIEQRNRKQATELLVEILEAKDPANKRALRLAAASSLADEDLGNQAIACLQAALRSEQNPCRDSFVLGKLGIALLEADRAAEAAEAFAQLVEIEPKSSLATGYLAEAHRRAGNTTEAARWQTRTLDLGPPSGDSPDWAEDAATVAPVSASQ